MGMMKGKITVALMALTMLCNTDAAAQRKSYKAVLRTTDAAHFKTEEAARIGDQLIEYQRVTGGWAKNIDMVRPMTSEEHAEVAAQKDRRNDSTTDNDATTMQMEYLARLYKATGEARYKEAVVRGVEYLLAGQYDNGGWPQFWPEMRDYQPLITYNDGAMVHTMQVMRAVRDREAPYDAKGLLSKELRQRAARAFDKGVECILNTQMVVDGRLTVWCQQHDQNTLEPAKARAYELPSYCSSESAGLVDLLMQLPKPDERVRRAVRAAMDWFEDYKITGYRYDRQWPKPGGKVSALVADLQAQPLWARYYDLEHCEPYVCDRDGIIRRRLDEIGPERRNGYGWYQDAVSGLYAKYNAWSRKHEGKDARTLNVNTPGGNERGVFRLFREQKADHTLFDAEVRPGESIQQVLEQAPSDSTREYKVLVRAGVYRERLVIDRPNVVLVGEDREKTVVECAILNEEDRDHTYRGRKVGSGVIVLTDRASDCVISGLTVVNNYGSTVRPTTSHQMAIFGRATRTIIVNCNIRSDGNDALSLWGRGGMYYHADLNIECPGVDFICPRGWCYATRCRFVGDGRAILWHDGRADKKAKFVVTNSYFDAKRPTPLGRWHHDAQFFVVNCGMSANIMDRNIRYAYTDKVLDPCPWGQRTYYYACQREGGHGGWMDNNLHEADKELSYFSATASWTFDGKWDPEVRLRELWPAIAYEMSHVY